MSFGKNLKRLRKKRGLTQLQLAFELKTSPGKILRYENGENYPRLTKAVEIAEYFGVSLDELIADDPPETSTGRKSLDEYQRRTVVAAINYRIKEEIKRLSEGMNVPAEQIRKIWEESNENQNHL